jgi:hypothetical protein
LDLTRRGISLLGLASEDWNDLEAQKNAGGRFSLNFPHEVARGGKPRSLVLIAVGGDTSNLRLGFIRSKQATASLDTRIVFDLVRPIVPGSLKVLLSGIDDRSLRAGIRKLSRNPIGFQGISKILGERIVRLVAASRKNAPVLQRIFAELDRPTKYQDARALQNNAVELAIKAFGGADGASEVVLPGGNTAIGAVRVLEDAVIEHDARWMPGWRLNASDLTGKATFRRRNQQLEVFTANKRPLEKLFGVDLIYLNRSRGAIVMVQYKMMEPVDANESSRKSLGLGSKKTGDPEWTVRIDSQFKDEMKRMETFDRDLDKSGSYRLNSGAFFFKLVRRQSKIQSTGIVVSLGHLRKLIAEGSAAGNRGGLSLSYGRLDGHYLRSDPFADLISSGYIGTRGATTRHLETLIKATLSEGRAVVAAIQTAWD